MMVQSTRASDIYNYVLTSDVLSTASMAAAQTATSDGSLNQRNRLQVQNLTLNTRGQTGVAVLQAGTSARETAARINDAISKKQGLVSARAETYATLALTGTESGTLDFKINGVSIQSYSKQVNNDVNDVILAINNTSGATGVVASLYNLVGGGSGILLHASQGEDIKISEMNVSLSSGAVGTVSVQGGYDSGGGVFGSIGAAVSLTAGGSGASRNTTVGGRVLLSNDVAFSVGHNATGSTGGLFAYSPTMLVPCAKGSSVDAIGVMTVSDSTKALDIIDAALGRINLYRGSLGSMQNRLEFTKENLSQSVEALSAARSRMRDADFANEMSDLMKVQVTQKAGMAMLSQANASSRRVLDLLN
jgi:flagellin